MAIVQTMTSNNQLFHDLKTMGRDNFSYEGAKALMEYLEQLADDCEMNIEYDPIAFCCEYSEYGTLEDFNEIYNSADPFDDWDQVGENTTVIEFSGGVIIQDF